MRLIDADALKKDFGEQRLDHDFCICGDESTARDLIDDAETVDAIPLVHAKWRFTGQFNLPTCSSCGKPSRDGEWDGTIYCPHCAAVMDGWGE